MRCYGTVASCDPVAGLGQVVSACGQPVAFLITALDDEILTWLSPGTPISFIRAAAESGPPTATMIRLGGPALPSARADTAR